MSADPQVTRQTTPETTPVEVDAPPDEPELPSRQKSTAPKPTVSLITLDDQHAVKPKEGSCHERITTFELAGVPDAAIGRNVNRLFSPQKLAILLSWTKGCPAGDGKCVRSKGGRRIACEGPFGPHDLKVNTTATVKYVDAQLLSVELLQAGDTGGMHGFYNLSGINIDLETGVIAGLDGWLRGADAIEWAKLGARQEATTREDPPYDLRAFEASRVDAEDLGGFADVYFTEDALFLIPSVAEVGRHERTNLRRIPWREIASRVPASSPLRPLVDQAP